MFGRGGAFFVVIQAVVSTAVYKCGSGNVLLP